MYYDLPFKATDDADWAQQVELIDETTNLPLADAATASFELSVLENGCSVLTASTSAGTITKPNDYTILWRFTAAQMNGLCIGTSYRVGCRMTTATGQVQQVFVGTLVVVGGGFR